MPELIIPTNLTMKYPILIDSEALRTFDRILDEAEEKLKIVTEGEITKMVEYKFNRWKGSRDLEGLSDNQLESEKQ